MFCRRMIDHDKVETSSVLVERYPMVSFAVLLPLQLRSEVLDRFVDSVEHWNLQQSKLKTEATYRKRAIK